MGRGIAPQETTLDLFLGSVIHDGIAAMIHGVDIDDIVRAGVEQLSAKLLEGRANNDDARFFAKEQCALAEGLLRGFHRLHWPRIVADYPEVVLCEKELTYDYVLDGTALRFLSKPDLVRRAKDGGLWVFEWKTTSSNKEEWIHQWETAVQVHAQIKTVEEHLKEPVAGCIVQGFYKGYVSQWNRQESMLIYAYHHPGNPPWEKPRWAYEYKPGLKKYPVWQKEGGVKQWVAEMPLALLASQFPQTPPIFVKDELVEAFFRQQGLREIAIKSALNMDPYGEADQRTMDRLFPQHFESCNAWNRPCAFRRLCFGAEVDPMDIGYTPRVSHHQMEQDAIDASDSAE